MLSPVNTAYFIPGNMNVHDYIDQFWPILFLYNFKMCVALTNTLRLAASDHGLATALFIHMQISGRIL